MAAIQKINFLIWFPICFFRQFLAKTYRFTTVENVTDDRHCANNTIGQESNNR